MKVTLSGLSGLLITMLLPVRVFAFGISPPEEFFDFISVGSSQTVSVLLSRSPNEVGDLLVSVKPRKSAADFFFGEESFIFSSTLREIEYRYNIIPQPATQSSQELYVTFLLAPLESVTTGVSVITGATQVVRFSTDLAQTDVGTLSSGISGGSYSQTDIPTLVSDNSGVTPDQQTQTNVSIPQSPESSVETPSVPDSTSKQTESTPIQPPISDTPSIVSSQDTFEKKVVAEDSAPSGSKKSQPNITSITHPSADLYVANPRVVLFLQDVGINEENKMLYLLNQSPDVKVDDLKYETKTPSISFDLPDGVYYFHIAQQNADQSEIITRRIMVDTTPPVIDVNVKKQPDLSLFFKRATTIAVNAFDVLSGVEDVRVQLNHKDVQIKQGVVFLKGLNFGEHTLTVDSTDKAGNVVIHTFEVTVEPKYPIVKTSRHLFSLLTDLIFGWMH